MGDSPPRPTAVWFEQAKLEWILGAKGHGPEWARVFQTGPEDWELVWRAIAEATLGATIKEVRDRSPYGISSGVKIRLAIDDRSAQTIVSVTAYPTPWHGEAMEITHEISLFDIVELIERIDDAPAGARGGVLEFYTPDTAMLEILEPELGPAARIIFARLGELRVVKPSSKSSWPTHRPGTG